MIKNTTLEGDCLGSNPSFDTNCVTWIILYFSFPYLRNRGNEKYLPHSIIVKIKLLNI